MKKIFVVALFQIIFGAALWAQSDGNHWDPRFRACGVRAYEVIDDGSHLIINGVFHDFKLSPPAPLIWDGATWSNLGAGLLSSDVGSTGIHKMLLRNGQLFLAGYFDTISDGTRARNIIGYDKATKAWFTLAEGVAGTGFTFISDMVADSTHLYLSVIEHAEDKGSIRRWSFIDKRWDTIATLKRDPQEDAIEVHQLLIRNNILYAAGNFDTINGSAFTNLAVYDIATGTWSQLGDPLIKARNAYENIVSSMVLVGEDSLYVAGRFDSAGSVRLNNVACWDGSSWQPLQNGVKVYFDFEPPLLTYSNNSLYIYNASPHKPDTVTVFARWDGAHWHTVDTVLTKKIGFTFRETRLRFINNRIFITRATYPSAQDEGVYSGWWNGRHLIDIDSGKGCYGINGARDYTDVTALYADGSDIYIGGRFRRAGGKPASGIAKWDGADWTPIVDQQMTDHGQSPFSGGINAIAKYKGDLYFAGNYSGPVIGKDTFWSIAKWDGNSFSVPGGSAIRQPQWMPNSLVVFKDRLIMGGYFKGLTKGLNYIAQWDGTEWKPLGSGIAPPKDSVKYPIWGVRTLYADENYLYVGGQFTDVGGINVTSLARWDGTKWDTVGHLGKKPVSGLAALPYVTYITKGRNGLLITGGYDTVAYKPYRGIVFYDGNTLLPYGDTSVAEHIVGSQSTIAALNRYIFYWGNRMDGMPVVEPVRVYNEHVFPISVGLTDGNEDIGDENVLLKFNNLGELYLAGSFIRAGDMPSRYFGIWREPRILEKVTSYPSSTQLLRSIYPNPAATTIYLEKSDPAAEALELHVADALGRKIRTILFERELMQTTFDVSDLPSGIYTVTYSRQHQQNVQKLIISR